MSSETYSNTIRAAFQIKELLAVHPELKERFDEVLAYMEKYDLAKAGTNDFNGTSDTIEHDIVNDWTGEQPVSEDEFVRTVAEIAASIINLRVAFKMVTGCSLGIIYVEGGHDRDDVNDEWVWYISDAYPPSRLVPAAQTLADSGVVLGDVGWTEVG